MFDDGSLTCFPPFQREIACALDPPPMAPSIGQEQKRESFLIKEDIVPLAIRHEPIKQCFPLNTYEEDTGVFSDPVKPWRAKNMQDSEVESPFRSIARVSSMSASCPSINTSIPLEPEPTASFEPKSPSRPPCSCQEYSRLKRQ